MLYVSENIENSAMYDVIMSLCKIFIGKHFKHFDFYLFQVFEQNHREIIICTFFEIWRIRPKGLIIYLIDDRSLINNDFEFIGALMEHFVIALVSYLRKEDLYFL